MRMLGEMATANPDTGSFSVYADRALGCWAGFTIGWLYWWVWALIIPVEATAGVTILAKWVDWPQWVFAFLITAILTATNLIIVGKYGEFEFWFALIKVVVIVAFIAVGVRAILPGSHVSGVHALTDHGFFGGIFAAMLTTTTTHLGTEIVTIAAAESDNPVGGIRKAVNSVIWRISIFYLGSIFVVVSIVNWRSTGARESDFAPVYAQDDRARAAQHGARSRYTHRGGQLPRLRALHGSRMAFSLGQRGDAPKAFARPSRRGVPVTIILASVVVGFICVALNYVLPDRIFAYLLSTAGARHCSSTCASRSRSCVRATRWMRRGCLCGCTCGSSPIAPTL